ncbi:MAG TPA: hypothetical protein VMB27_05715 [Solirubrobacteraceae bacterium]|nr:hypothetical protein [Solirubrobacteraceae bacterium]
MAIRVRRALVGLATAAAVLILPASALAAGEGLTVTPANLQAGGATNVTAALTFASGDTPKTVVTSLAPGMLGNLNANATCLGAQQLTAGCQVGTATVSTDVAGNITGNLYLVPGQGTDAAGIEFAPPAPLTNQYIGVSANPNAPGGLNLTTTFPNPSPASITGFTANFTTLNGQPFTRLPSSCGAATSSFSTTYYGATPTGSASGSFTPTGCTSLPYAPVLSTTETKDAKDSGATLVFSITQAAGESASKTISLKLPSGLGVNLSADVLCLTGSGPGCVVGTATATSPLIPSAALSNGTINLGGSATAPTITVAFPSFGITLVGDVSLGSGTVTINNVPDVPLTSLNLNITGPNGQKAFTTKCQASSTTGTFTAQSGATHTVTSAVKFVNCPSSPTATGSFSGLARGKPGLRFTVTHGKNAGNVSSVAVGLPGGLKFSRAGIVTSKVCTTKAGKKKCTTTTLTKGLGIKGATAKSIALKGGKLVITLKKAAGKVTISLGGPVLTESGSLQTKVKKHKVKNPLTVTLKVTDAKNVSTSVPLKLKAH